MSDEGAPSRTRGAEPRSGTIIADRYRVDRLLARGGMAAVYLAHHVRLNRPVALKVLSPPPDADEAGSFEERFKLEAETLASLDHRNIVILHDFGETDDGRFFLAMEYIDGPRLTDIVKAGPLPWSRALHLLLQVCAALTYAHRRGVVHRDLKPSNLLIRLDDHGNEVVKVVDFGLVKLTEQDQSITRAGLILGSPHCMAPEQVKGVDIDHRADIYAVGVLLYRCITGRYPFHGNHSAATMVAHINEPVRYWREIAPDLEVPEGLEAIVRRCLEKRPAHRWPDMASLMDELSAMLGITADQLRTLSSLTHSSIQREAIPAPASGPSQLMVVGVIGLLGVAGFMTLAALGGGFLLATASRGSKQPPPTIEAPLAEPAPEATPQAEAAPGAAEPEAPPGAAEPEAPPGAAEPEAPPGTAEAAEPIPPAGDAAPKPPPVAEPAASAPRQPATPAAAPLPADPGPAATDPATPEPPLTNEPPEGHDADEVEAPEGYMGLPDDLF